MSSIPIRAEDLELLGALRPYVGSAGQHFLSTLIELMAEEKEKTQAQVVDALNIRGNVHQLMSEEATKAYSLFLISALLDLTERSVPSLPAPSGAGARVPLSP